LLLLDEPSRSLDPDGVVHLHQLLRELQAEGMTIVMSTHNLDEAHELADRVIALDGGSIVFDRPTGDFPVTSDLHRFYFEQVGHRA
jgi:ABC-type multidrug transport system ATPase subunit